MPNVSLRREISEAMRRVRKSRFMPRHLIKGAFLAAGQELKRYRPQEHDLPRLIRFLADRRIETLLDVGANEGQFGKRIREADYRGRIVSFEPLPEAHEKLSAAAARDGNWLVAERCALGAAPGRATLNVAANSVSSSLLPMLDRHIAAAPGSHYVGTAPVEIARLDDVLARYVAPDSGPLALKMDTQGFEGAVLKGAEQSLARIGLVYFEASLTKLYEGAPSFTDLARFLEERNYRCLSISSAMVDGATYEMLQVDVTYARG